MSWTATTRLSDTEKDIRVAMSKKRYQISVYKFQGSKTRQRYALMIGWRRLWIKCLYELVGGNT